MGQATADLPNPTSPAAEVTGNADDLLSQLAGEEIDRLLAEAETEPTHLEPESQAATESAIAQNLAAATAEHTEIAASAVQTNEEPAPAIQTTEPVAIAGGEVPEDAPAPVVDSLVEKEIAEMAAASAAAQPTKDAFAAQVDELFKELKDLPEQEAATDSAPTEKPAAPAKPEPPLSSAAAEIAAELDREANSAERAALQPAASAAPVEQPQAADEDDAPPSVLVKVLEVVNSPVESLPDTLRDALGKIAILTTMNALGVLLYLVLFRR